jgi:hypothetical protein
MRDTKMVGPIVVAPLFCDTGMSTNGDMTYTLGSISAVWARLACFQMSCLGQACVLSNELIGQNSVVLLVSWYFVYN